MTKLVLWDIDGTLVHAGDIAADVFESAVERVIGVRPMTRIRMSGKTDPQIAREYLESMGVVDIAANLPKTLDALFEELSANRRLIRDQGRVLPGVVDALDALDAFDGLDKALLTGNLKENARIKLEAFHLDQRFDFEVGAYGSDHHDRTMLVPIVLERQRRLRRREILPEEVLVIGDSPNDLACARAGGARCLLVATGRSTVAELRALGPDFVHEDLKDTGAFLETLNSAAPR